MASLIRNAGLLLAVSGLLAGCSPEARRVRDGGPGADPGNKMVIDAPPANPHAADTTLWPGRAPAPVERLAAGTMPEQRAFTKSARDPRTGPKRRR
jgi:hypothetical protein